MRGRARASIIFLLIGGLLLYISYLLRPTSTPTESFISTALSGAAFVILAVTILDFLWGLLGGEPLSKTLNDLRQSFRLFDDNMQRYISLLGDSRTTGVIRLFSVSGDFGSPGDWMRRLKAAHQQIDLMGYTLHVWTKGANFEEEVLKLVQRGIQVRILIMDEKNPYFDSFLNIDQISGISAVFARAELQQAQRAFEDIGLKVRNMKSANSTGSFELRTVRKGLIVTHICRVDSEMVVITYIYSEVASRSPLMLIQGQESQMFQTYQKEFDQLWELNGSQSVIRSTAS